MRRTCMHRELSEILVTLVESMALAIRERRGKGGGGKGEERICAQHHFGHC